ncbi:MAG: penicillin-binding protein 2 [Chloroflexi bacterium]|nr:penicillin-binding protein 2 [Chloroflexota bacterium]
MSGRLRFLFAMFAVASLILAGRVAYWQTAGRLTLFDRANDQIRSELVIEAHRGVIRDRGGAILATTVDLRSLYAIPKRIPDHAAAAASLAPLLGADAAKLRAALGSGGEWVFLARRLPEPTAKAIERLGIPGLGFEKEPKRLYPNETIAAHVLGFVDDDGAGQYGVEGRYDKILRGRNGLRVVDRDPANRELAVGLRSEIPAQDGADLVLTIDLAMQSAAERELRAAVEREGAPGGTIVVLDPRDGAVRAMASYPTFDPSRVARANPEALRDRAIAWTYEPGSTMKTMTVAGAIEEKLVTPETTYEDRGFAIIGGRRLNNALGRSWGTTSVRQVLERSLNAGAVFVGAKLGAQKLHDYLARFGFGAKTGIDLVGEQSGSVRPIAEWYPVDVGTASFGQGMSATPMQLAAAYAAVANGGTLYKPYVVASVRDQAGERKTAPQAVRRVISTGTAATMRDMLTTTVDDGLARNAQLTAYSVAGKTGTAQIAGPNGAYEDDIYNSSFAGFAPANDAHAVVVIVLERPESRLLGTVTATTAFRGVALDVLHGERIAPDRASEKR